MALLVGASAWAATGAGARLWYPSLTPPPGTPADDAFSIICAALYILMGVAAWRVWAVAAHPGAYAALRLWGWQLLANAAWSPVFFGLHAVGVALVLALGLFALVIATLLAFARRDRIAALLFAPYPIWLAYAAWLNAGLWWLNGRPFP